MATDKDATDRFEGTQPNPVPDGGILTVHYADAHQAKQTVQVVVADRDDASETAALEIPLRGNGKGSTLFIVPAGWGGVVLSNDKSRSHSVDVALPP